MLREMMGIKPTPEPRTDPRELHARGVATGFALARRTAAAKARQLGYDTLAADIERMTCERKESK